MRVIVTGSRNYAWRYENFLKNHPHGFANNATIEPKRLDDIDRKKAYGYFLKAVDHAVGIGCGYVTFVHGDCPTGFDRICSDWIQVYGSLCSRILVIEEKHPADWKKHGKAAGPIRNHEMVDSGGDYLIAGWDDKTKNSGTLDCMTYAVLKGIDVKICSPYKPLGDSFI